MVEKYENFYSKWLYKGNKKTYANGYLEVQLHKYPFHSGLRILVTDGFKYFKDIHCDSIFQAKEEFKRQIDLIS